MKGSAGYLLDKIAEDPKAWVVVRNRQNYDAFLNVLLVPQAEYCMGSYTYQSHFVTIWQRPTSFTIPEQIELEEFKVLRILTNSRMSIDGWEVAKVTPARRNAHLQPQS